MWSVIAAFGAAITAAASGAVLVRRASRRPNRAMATIIGHETVEMSEGHAYRTKVEFDDPACGRRVAVLGGATYPARGEVGERVAVRHGSTDSVVVRDTFLARWGWALFAFGLAVSMAAVGVYELLH